MVPRSLRGARVRIGAMWGSSSGPEDPVSGKLRLLSYCYYSNNNPPNNRTNQKQTLKKEEWFLGVCSVSTLKSVSIRLGLCVTCRLGLYIRLGLDLEKGAPLRCLALFGHTYSFMTL